jgi:hypothetical protein
VSDGRPEKPNVLFWLAVAGAVLALPVAVFTTCQVRGEYELPPGEEEVPGAGVMYELVSLAGGLVIGVLLAIVLVWVAARLRLMDPPGANRQRPPPGSEPSPLLPADWQAPWRQQPKGPGPSIRPADGPIREPPEGDQ